MTIGSILERNRKLAIIKNECYKKLSLFCLLDYKENWIIWRENIAINFVVNFVINQNVWNEGLGMKGMYYKQFSWNGIFANGKSFLASSWDVF